MFKKILSASLVVLHILTQSAGAVEFWPIFQPVAVQTIQAQTLQVPSDILKNESRLSVSGDFSFFNISECFKFGLCRGESGADDGTGVILPVGRMTSNLRLDNFGAYLRAPAQAQIRDEAPRRAKHSSGLLTIFEGMNDKHPEKGVLDVYHFDWSKEGQQGGTALMNLTYDTLSRRAQKDLTGTATKQAIYTYDIADQLTTLENKISGGATISKHDYTYDNVSNRLTHAITAAANKSYTYTYNNIYELTGVSGSETSSFAYDKLGNRTTANSIPYTSNNLNQYTAVNSVTHTYDNNGNLTGDGTNTYGYDIESRLTSFSKSGTTASYTYDAFNRRVSKTVNGTTIYYVYDGDDIIEERSSAGALNADWVHGDQIDEPLTMTRGGTTYYYTRDALGSVRELTNSAGTVQETYTYNSYGQLSAAPTINNPFTFTGREYDSESGNYYYRRRYYDPFLGRFLQRDPIGYWDSMNLQQYVLNNPVNWVDPTGLDAVVFKDENGIHFGVAVDTTKGVYRIEMTPGWEWSPVAPAKIQITPWKGYPGTVLGEPIKITPDQGDQFIKWAEDYIKDYKGPYIIGGADCRDLACELYKAAQEFNPDQEPQTCPSMPIN